MDPGPVPSVPWGTTQINADTQCEGSYLHDFGVGVSRYSGAVTRIGGDPVLS